MGALYFVHIISRCLSSFVIIKCTSLCCLHIFDRTLVDPTLLFPHSPFCSHIEILCGSCTMRVFSPLCSSHKFLQVSFTAAIPTSYNTMLAHTKSESTAVSEERNDNAPLRTNSGALLCYFCVVNDHGAKETTDVALLSGQLHHGHHGSS